MSRITMTADEVAETRAVLSELAERYDSPESQEFLDEADLIAHDVPRRIRKALREFRLFEPEGALLIVSGWPVDDERIGPTPAHWKEHGPGNDTRQEELLLVLLSALLGDPIAWSTQQDGRVVHDLLPIKGHEHEQVGTGSEELITWHVEDAFHPYRGDYLGMMCLRNDDRVPTTFAPISKVELSADQRAVLASPHFVIRPDNSHLPKNRGNANGRSPAEEALVEKAYRKIEQMCASPERIPVFFGDPGTPYVRMDPYFMDSPEDPEARATFEELQRRVDEALEDCVLEPGDICFIDNYQAVHGRKPFKARYDGRDRWLKRINVVRDLRKSREARVSATSRVLY
ncbi:MAG TPA: guanitoxin biosynthesis L-enduracididine beta-hydroxylase GntD [Longimicrobium sp.]|jgi:Fe(II)/alpha-ketoglutarate-dependent arginine beta-hydroxylase|nr:guanitoxin biosynthesis L-enduracididine beta-hydroxylase GntD [Longimicrobium sp.]